MPNPVMVNRRKHILGLVNTALQTIAYDASTNQTGVHIYKSYSMLSKASSRKPSVFAAVEFSTNDAQRREDGDYVVKDGTCAITLYLELAVTTRSDNALDDEYSRVKELVEYAIESGLPNKVAENSRYIFETNRACCVGDFPLFSTEDVAGSATMVFKLDYRETRKS